MPRTIGWIPISVLCAVIAGACSAEFLTLEVDGTQLPADDLAQIRSLEVLITHAGGNRVRTYPLAGELDDGFTSIAVRLGSASGDATFAVRGLSEAGATVASGTTTAALLEGARVVVVLGGGPLPDGGGPDAGGLDAGTDSGAPCIDGETACMGTDLYECIGGSLVMQSTCAAGCVADPTARCLQIVPSNALDPALLDQATAPFDGAADMETSYTFDTDDGEIMAGSTVLRPAGTGKIGGIGFELVVQGIGSPDIGVWTLTSFDLPAGEQLDIVGTNAAGIVVNDTLVVAGTVDLGARGMTSMFEDIPGPGGYVGGTDRVDVGNGDGNGGGPGFGSWGSNAGFEDPGGGGGGHGGTGGAGGPTPMAMAPPGGNTYGMFSLVPLEGGSGGGAAGSNSGGPSLVPGGGGGGALQLVAGTSITVDGIITAPGGFGTGGIDGDSGGGGGSGGTILLEAPVVTIAGAVAANGGGGGSGAEANAVGAFGLEGERGRPDEMPAAGGAIAGAASGAGGAGGAGDACDGLDGGMADNGGGGGGGCGRIRINTLAGAATITGVLSPSAASGLTSEGIVTTQ